MLQSALERGHIVDLDPQAALNNALLQPERDKDMKKLEEYLRIYNGGLLWATIFWPLYLLVLALLLQQCASDSYVWAAALIPYVGIGAIAGFASIVAWAYKDKMGRFLTEWTTRVNTESSTHLEEMDKERALRRKQVIHVDAEWIKLYDAVLDDISSDVAKKYAGQYPNLTEVANAKKDQEVEG